MHITHQHRNDVIARCLLVLPKFGWQFGKVETSELIQLLACVSPKRLWATPLRTAIQFDRTRFQMETLF